MLIDCHTHLQDFSPEQLASDFARARDLGVSTIIGSGQTVESSRATVDLAQQHDFIRASVGIHPWTAILVDDQVRAQLLALARSPRVVAISETGLDYARTPETKEVQKQAFTAQLELARAVRLPVILHDREAHADMMEILRRHGQGVTGAIHGFAGTLDQVRNWLDLGFYVSIGRRSIDAANIAEVVAAVPHDRLLIETDASAGSGRLADGSRNEFAQLRTVANRLAEILGVSVEEIGERTTANLRRLTGLAG